MERLLVEKSVQGDLASFEKLVQLYDRYVYNIALRMLGSEEDAKDAAQEAFIKAYRGISRFKQESAFSTWLYRITLNVCKDELRKRKDALIYYEDERSGETRNIVESLGSESLDPLIIYEQRELRSELHEAMQDISQEHREVIILKDMLGESYESIAASVGIPVGTVRSRLSRARLSLREKMQERMAR